MAIFITGASSGIGLALAQTLCQPEGHIALGLVARRGDRLDALLAQDLPTTVFTSIASMSVIARRCTPLQRTSSSRLEQSIW
jgi:NADP-dependent 3-hydroxy acid dehydrogenase YdfG